MRWLQIGFVVGILFFSASANSSEREYRLDGQFSGCSSGKFYLLSNNKLMRCTGFSSGFMFRPIVVVEGNRVRSVGGREVRAEVLDGNVIVTSINGTYEGCDYNKVYKLMNGKMMQCSSYGYSYAYAPSVYVIADKVMAVDGEEVDAKVVEGTTIETRVSGEWNGCDFDENNLHRLMNGLILMCHTYFYEYAYMPEVIITVINNDVHSIAINGTLRDGVSVFRPD